MQNPTEAILGYVAYQAWAVTLGAFWFYSQIAKRASSVPDYEKGMTAGMSNHGQWFYVYPWQQTVFWVALFGGIAGFMIAVFITQRHFGKEALKKMRPLTLFLAVVLAIFGWSLVTQQM